MGTRFVERLRDRIEHLALGSGWEVEYPRGKWRLRNLGIQPGRDVATIDFAPVSQPWLAAWPMLALSGVEWIAMRVPPVQPWMACGELALRARMQHPYGPCGSPVVSRSVTAKRPVGVGALGCPIATM